jgi:type IV secretory pathway VirB6-like protein
LKKKITKISAYIKKEELSHIINELHCLIKFINKTDSIANHITEKLEKINIMTHDQASEIYINYQLDKILENIDKRNIKKYTQKEKFTNFTIYTYDEHYDIYATIYTDEITNILHKLLKNKEIEKIA